MDDDEADGEPLLSGGVSKRPFCFKSGWVSPGRGLCGAEVSMVMGFQDNKKEPLEE